MFIALRKDIFFLVSGIIIIEKKINKTCESEMGMYRM